MKALKIIVIVIIIVAFAWGLFNIIGEKITLQAETAKIKTELFSLTEENTRLSSKIEYLQRPENILKEAKSEFNYREPDEKLIVIISQTTTTE